MKPAAALTRRSGWRRLAGGAPRQHGFTLIELLLTLVLLLLLLGAVVMNFTSLQTGAQLDEGAEQFESLLRYARAHAANAGCRVRLTFEEAAGEDEMAAPLGNVFVSWESDPLGKPGEFHPLQEVAPLVESLLQMVEVDDVRAIGGGIGAPSGAVDSAATPEDEAAFAGFAPITFYPDGSSDSAEVVLLARDSEEERRVAVRIIGTTGTIRRETVYDALAAADGGGDAK